LHEEQQLMPDTFESFMRRYGPPDAYPVIEVGDTVEHWPFVVVTFADRTAVSQFCGLSADGEDNDPHLSIIIHAFVTGQIARSGVYGMENGRCYTTFDDTAPGTSHGWPAVQGVTVLIGAQSSPTSSD